MRTHVEKIRIIYWEYLGFGLVIVLLWLDEILDLPHVLLGAPATPLNWAESLLETVFLLMVAVVITTASRRILQRIRYLEAFMRVCSHCGRILADGVWIPIDQYLGEQTEVRITRGLCPHCEDTLYSPPSD